MNFCISNNFQLFRTVLLAFINCLVISTPQLKERNRLRNEFVGEFFSSLLASEISVYICDCMCNTMCKNTGVFKVIVASSWGGHCLL